MAAPKQHGDAPPPTTSGSSPGYALDVVRQPAMKAGIDGEYVNQALFDGGVCKCRVAEP